MSDDPTLFGDDGEPTDAAKPTDDGEVINLDPYREERKARDAAIARVDAAADEEWRAHAHATLAEVARRRQFLNADDVWEAGVEKPLEGRAMGPVMLWGGAQGLITPTTNYLPSRQKGCHMSPLRVWRSLVYRGEEAGAQPEVSL